MPTEKKMARAAAGETQQFSVPAPTRETQKSKATSTKSSSLAAQPAAHSKSPSKPPSNSGILRTDESAEAPSLEPAPSALWMASLNKRLHKDADRNDPKSYPAIDWKTFLPAPVIGIDEVGRGCLAGPVYAAAVYFNSDILTELVTDSKLLSEARREELSSEILKHHQVGIGVASVQEIDEINILQASLLAMRRAVKNLGVDSGHLLIDGNMRIPRMARTFTQTPVVKGDLRVALISAASIVAKVARDQLMKELSRKYPQYGFEFHKGYGTKDHQQTIAEHGPCKLHRRSFSGVKEYFAEDISGACDL